MSSLLAEELGTDKQSARAKLDAIHQAWDEQKRAEAQAVDVEADPYAKKQVRMIRGKYKGRLAFVDRKVKKKWRLQVEGVDWGLEFYDTMFQLVDPQPTQ